MLTFEIKEHDKGYDIVDDIGQVHATTKYQNIAIALLSYAEEKWDTNWDLTESYLRDNVHCPEEHVLPNSGRVKITLLKSYVHEDVYALRSVYAFEPIGEFDDSRAEDDIRDFLDKPACGCSHDCCGCSFGGADYITILGPVYIVTASYFHNY